MRWRWCSGLVLLAACGRLGFDAREVGGGSDAGGDAAARDAASGLAGLGEPCGSGCAPNLACTSGTCTGTLAYATGPQTLPTWTCSSPVTVVSADLALHRLAVPSDTALTFGTSLAIYADAACAHPVTGLEIAAGSDEATFYFTGSAGGSAGLFVTSAIAAGADQIEQIATPIGLALATPQHTMAGAVQDARFDPTGCNQVTLTTSATPGSATDIALAGASYFSDAMCSTPIGSVALGAAATTVNAYFLATGSGASFALSAHGPNLATASLALVDPNADVWIGGASCDQSWTTGACWSAGHAPSGTQTAYFTSACTTSCSPTIASDIAVGGLWLQPGYTGTVRQTTGRIETDGTDVNGTDLGDLRVDGGAFVGGTADIVTDPSGTGAVIFTGGSFTSTSKLFQIYCSDLVTSGSYAFAANNGTVQLGGSGTENHAYAIGGADFVTANLVFQKRASGAVTSTFVGGHRIVVGGALTWDVDQGATVSGGTIAALGSVNVVDNTSGPAAGRGTTVISIEGTAAQALVGTGSANLVSFLPSIAVRGSGTVTASGTIPLGGDWTVTSGAVDLTSNKTSVRIGDGDHAFAGNTTFYDLGLRAASGANPRTLTFAAGSTTTVTDALALAGGNGSRLRLRSSAPGTPWILTPPAGTTLGGQLDVADSAATRAIHAGSGSVDSGGNAMWVFP